LQNCLVGLSLRYTRTQAFTITITEAVPLSTNLPLENRFPSIWVASWENNQDLTTSVASASSGVEAHTDHESLVSRRPARRSATKETYSVLVKYILPRTLLYDKILQAVLSQLMTV